MILLFAAAGLAIIAVIVIAAMLSRREPQQPGRHSRRAALAAWADYGYVASDDDHGYGYYDEPADDDGDETAAFFAAERRPAEIACEPDPVPEVPHEEYLPAALAPVLDEFLTVPLAEAPVSPRRVPGRVLRPGRARAECPVLLPALAPAAGAVTSLAAMAQQAAANEHREVARLRVTVGELEGELQRLKDEAEFPHLREGQFGDWTTGEFAAVIDAMENEAIPA